MIGKYLQVYCSINGLISLCGGIPRKKNLWFLSGKNCNILPRPHVFSKMVFIRDFFPEKKGGLFWVGEIILSPWLFRGVQRSFLLTRTNLDLVFQMSLAVCCFFSIVTQASATKGAGWAQVLMKNQSQHSQLASFNYNMYNMYDVCMYLKKIYIYLWLYAFYLYIYIYIYLVRYH